MPHQPSLFPEDGEGPPGPRGDAARALEERFDRLVAPDESMRDQVVALVGRAVARTIPAYVLVNNKAEGSSPLTIEALAERLAAGDWRPAAEASSRG